MVTNKEDRSLLRLDSQTYTESVDKRVVAFTVKGTVAESENILSGRSGLKFVVVFTVQTSTRRL